MKVAVIGGGPAGLFLSILLRRQSSDRPLTASSAEIEVDVYERNPRDATFGWGVVFSEETLGNLRAADLEVMDAIAEHFARWNTIDTFRGDERVRSGGHSFCGLSRRTLLMTLAEHAERLGVRLHHGQEITDPERLQAEVDLLVIADGVHSKTRAHFAEHFKPHVAMGESPFIWLGTNQSFEAFTFAIRESEHGVFQAHAYQFEEGTSTFIIETNQEAFDKAGLEAKDEAEMLRYCEEVFAPDLGGHSLLCNRARFIHFETLTCEAWSFENAVLLGDAAHTAHFSVGSGTKMAMEDSIALAAAIGEHGATPAALEAYEEERRPMVGRTQKAASQSAAWFDAMPRHLQHSTERLAFSLLSRTRQITHDNLALRDAGYVEQIDRWFRESQGASDSALEPKRTPMFTPFALRGLVIPNRTVVSPMCMYSADEGVPGDFHLVHLGSRAIGGCGLLMTEMTDVCPEGRITRGCAGIWNDKQAAAWERIVDFVHANSAAKIGLQLAHAGRKAGTKLPWDSYNESLGSDGWPLAAPSAIAWSDAHVVPKEMTLADMKEVRELFVAGAKRVAKAGFDLLELHAAHGYLLSSFLSPLSNQRGDAYGGSVENRMRFVLEVTDAVRQVWEAPLAVRISATDWAEGGFDVEQAVVVCAALKEHGVDIVDVSAGQTSTQAKPVYGRAFQTPFSERIRNDVGIPTITVGNINDHDRINTILVAGRADLVAMARAHLADPYFALRAAAEQGQDVHWPKQYRAGKDMLKRMVKGRG